MRNAVLHLISNKSGGFASPALPPYSAYTPYQATADEDFIRSKLRINDSNYHLINSMLAVYSFSEIYSEFRETSRTFQIKDLQTNSVTISGASYANTETENFNIVNIPTSFPSVNYFNWQIQYQDLENLNFIGCDISVTVPYTLTTVTQDTTTYRLLTAEWPAVAGIKGGFALDSNLSWSTGNSFSLTVYPCSFPYAAAVSYIEKYAQTASVLNAAGLARNYYNAQTSIEKYATLMLALANPALRNPATSANCN